VLWFERMGEDREDPAIVPLPIVSSIDEQELQQGLVRLATADLRPIVPDHVRRRIVNVVVQAIMRTSAGTKIDRSKLETLIESAFGSLYDGQTFSFELVLKALLKVPGMSEGDLYIGIVNLRVLLDAIGVQMEEPQMSLDAATRAMLLREAERAAEDARLEHEAARARSKPGGKRLRLGDLLVNERHIEPDDLRDALSFQQRFGGKLGSNLVDLGLITEEALAKFLGVQLNAPCCLSEREINAIPPDVIVQVSRDLAQRYKVLPMAVEKQRLRLIMEDPTDFEVIDDVGFRTGQAILPVVAPEFLILYGLEKHYGVKRSSRLLRAQGAAGADPELHNDPWAANELHSSYVSIGAAPPAPEPAAPPPVQSAKPAIAVRLPVAPAPAPAAPPPPSAPVAPARQKGPDAKRKALANDLLESEQDLDVYTITLQHFAQLFQRAALFLVNGQSVQGWMRSDSGGPLQIFRKTHIEFSGGAGVLSHALHTRAPSWGRLPESDENSNLRGALELGVEATILCMPFGIRNVVGFIVAAAPAPGVEVDLASIGRESEMIGAAIEIVRLRNEIMSLA
jgi:hypothetical protein